MFGCSAVFAKKEIHLKNTFSLNFKITYKAVINHSHPLFDLLCFALDAVSCCNFCLVVSLFFLSVHFLVL